MGGVSYVDAIISQLCFSSRALNDCNMMLKGGSFFLWETTLRVVHCVCAYGVCVWMGVGAKHAHV